MNKNNGNQMPDYHVYDFVSHFKQVGGSFNSLFKRLPGIENSQAFLCDMLEQLEKPENSELKQIFDKTLASSDYARRLLVRDKAWIMAEKWQNPSETSGAAEVSYMKTWLPEITAKIEPESQQNQLTHDAQYEEVERNMRGDDETDDSKDSQWTKPNNMPGSFPPAQSDEDNEMAEAEKRLAKIQSNLIDPYKFNGVSRDYKSGLLC